MDKKISGSEYPLSKIFSSDFEYRIPTYQRPYAWTTEEASELFDDLYEFYARGDEDNYFLGSIVLIKKEVEPLSYVIDGQQRLTTLTILLATIRYFLKDEKLKNHLATFIFEEGNAFEDIEPKPRLTLRERDQSFFARYVQSFNFDALWTLDPAGLDNESQKNIQENSRLLHDKLDKTFGGDETKIALFGRFLVKHCFLVAVSTPSQQSAFRVFSVLNNRGLDLLPSDIIKADVIGKIPPNQQEVFTKKWEELEIQTGRAGFNDLLSHIRMIYAKEKAKRTLLEEFKELVLPKHSPIDLFETILEPYAEAFITAKAQQYESVKNAQDVNYFLKWLNRIENSDWMPPSIFFLAQKKDQPDYVLYFFKKIERLAAYMHICAKNVNQRIERYAEVLTELEKEHSLEHPLSSIDLSVAEVAEMKAALGARIYELTARRRNYLILRLDSFLNDGAATYDPTLLTIEHVLPQTVTPDSEWAQWWPDAQERDEWVHRIANLVPLTRKRNSSASNYDFKKKKDKYFSGNKGVTSYALTSQVLKQSAWTPSIVKSRQRDLLGALFEGWDLR